MFIRLYIYSIDKYLFIYLIHNISKLLQNLSGIEPFNVDIQETTNLGKKWKLCQQKIDLFQSRVEQEIVCFPT